MDFTLLRSEAKAALHDAGSLCSEANQLYTQSLGSVEASIVLLARGQFLITAFQSQLQKMGNAYILLEHNISELEKSCSHSLAGLSAADVNIGRLLEQLEETPLHDDPGRNLREFVHDKDVAQLRDQLRDLHARLETSSGALATLPAQAQKEIGLLRAGMPQLADVSVQDLQRLTESVTANVQEMAALLEGVTQHYDLCCEAATLSDPLEIEEVQGVLEEDQIQLQDALKTLQMTRDLMVKLELNAASTKESLRASTRDLSKFFGKLDAFCKSKLKTYIDQLDEHSAQLRQRFHGATELVQEVEGLCEYYKMFQQGYEALLKEKQRRTKYQDQLDHLVAEINVQMRKHHQKELGMRSEFIRLYGEYLPSDIWSDLDAEPELYLVSRGNGANGHPLPNGHSGHSGHSAPRHARSPSLSPQASPPTKAVDALYI